MQWLESWNHLGKKLQKYEAIWQHSMLQKPQLLRDIYPEHWLDLFQKTQVQQIAAEFWQGPKPHWPKDLSAFFTFCLSSPPSFDQEDERKTSCLPMHLTPKKHHEITKILSLMDALKPGARGLDVAGGMGHLAHHIQNRGHTVTSLDYDKDLQHQGHLLYGSSGPKFHHGDLLKDDISDLLRGKDFTIGLHTCGELANRHIEMASTAQTPLIINFGCCYDKIPMTNQENAPLHLCSTAHHLASRFHGTPTNTPLASPYRFSLMLWLRHQGETPFRSLGRPKKAWLKQDFASYALPLLAKEYPYLKPSKRELNLFFQQAHIQRNTKALVTANLIRILIGRPLELYVLIGRAHLLEKKGYRTKLYSVFHDRVSPRNIGIVAKLT